MKQNDKVNYSHYNINRGTGTLTQNNAQETGKFGKVFYLLINYDHFFRSCFIAAYETTIRINASGIAAAAERDKKREQHLTKLPR